MLSSNDYEYLLKIRRTIHQNPEIGLDLPETRKVIKQFLKDNNLEFFENAGGIFGVIEPRKYEDVILIRADTDALPLVENNDLEFKSKNNYMHACGHDLHTVMLMGAILHAKRNKEKLNKKIIYVFQTNEEGGTGAKTLLKDSFFSQHKYYKAYALHVDAKLPINTVAYGLGGTFASNDSFNLTIVGKTGHGARPFEAIDPINAFIQLVNAIKTMIQNEFNVFNHNILSFTSVHAGTTHNIIPDKLEAKLSLRTYHNQDRMLILQRIKQITENYSKALKVEIKLAKIAEISPVYTDSELTKNEVEKINNYTDYKIVKDPVVKVGSEDFAEYANSKSKLCYLFVGSGLDNKTGSQYGQHNANVIFNENSVKVGVKLWETILLKD